MAILSSWVLLVFATAVYCRSYWPGEQELPRKIVHIGVGPIVPLAWWLDVPRIVAIPVALTITLAALVNHRWHMFHAIEDVQRRSYGTVAYGLAITVMLLLYWPAQPAAVCAGTLVMAFGDGFAGLAGQTLRSPSWHLGNQQKSVAGTAVMAVTSCLVLTTLILLSGSALPLLRLLLVTGLLVGLEQLSSLGLDNLTVPLAAALSWDWLILP
ncbi:dolichol kinase [cyanobiont of Ornithocercus magnificus]|nr:dolichol kinase [cyanobiont of Ornithocercus magnificus]